MKYTGKRIKELREKAGENQEQLAKALGAANRETIARWESGTRDLKRQHIIAIAKHFNVTTDYLLGLSNAQTVEKDIKNACNATGLTEKAIEKIGDCPKTFAEILSYMILNANFFELLDDIDDMLLSNKRPYTFLVKDGEYPKPISTAVLKEIYQQTALKNMQYILQDLSDNYSIDENGHLIKETNQGSTGKGINKALKE